MVGGRSQVARRTGHVDRGVVQVDRVPAVAEPREHPGADHSGDARNGRRPSFVTAAPPQVARALYEDVVRELSASGLRVATGEFQAMMQVALVNDGPVTILLDSRKTF